MTQQELREHIERVVRNAVREQRAKAKSQTDPLYEATQRIVNEQFGNLLREKAKDDNNKRAFVINALRGNKGNKYNHAEFARKLWHPKDQSEEDTYRSLFSKKLSGKPDADGAIRSFDDHEINKLYELLRQQ